MLTNLKLDGFKSFVSNSLEFRNLTIFTGLNSSGKSSVFQALRILERASLGKKNPLLKGHGSLEELRNIYTKSMNISASFSSCKGSGFAQYCDGSVDVNGQFPEIIYVSADRYGPRTSIPVEDSFMMGPRGENILRCIEHYEYSNLSPFLKHEHSQGETFNYNLEAWLGAISPGVRFSYNILKQADSSYSLFNDHRAVNVGFGLSYTLPIIVALFMGTLKENTIVLLENPEAHLHPKGQAELARLISLSVQAGAQVFVETHSDHLFDGVRIFAKNNEGFESKVSLYWFELDDENNTIISSPKLVKYGRLDNWPKGMFDQFENNAIQLL